MSSQQKIYDFTPKQFLKGAALAAVRPGTFPANGPEVDERIEPVVLGDGVDGQVVIDRSGNRRPKRNPQNQPLGTCKNLSLSS